MIFVRSEPPNAEFGFEIDFEGGGRVIPDSRFRGGLMAVLK
jgi:hypothetical protein